MIQVNVTHSPDSNKIGTVVFNKNLIYIGNDHSCDLNLIDQEVLSNHLIIEIIETKMYAHPHRDVEYFLVNGKRSSGHKTLFIGNKVKIGKTEFIIENYLETPIVKYKDYLNQVTDDLITNNSPLLKIIKEVQKY